MKINLIIMAILLLLPIGIRAGEIANINVGGYYATDVEALGVSFQGMRKLQDGLFELSAVGSFGEGDNSIGITPGLFIMEGGKMELALLSGITTKWESTGGPAYVAGTNGLYATYALPWLGRVYGQWQREWPFDKDGALEATHKFTFGISLTIPSSP